MDKILRIDMGAEGGPRVSDVAAGEYAGLGGRGMTSAIVSKEVPALCHPLGPENKLVIAPGLLSGSAAVISGRISVGCKSPLTGGIKESNAGGQAGQVLAKLGYAAIVIEGKPKTEDLYKIFINKDGVKISVDNSLKMLPNYDLVDKMKAEFGDKIACISIGPAGEMKLGAASVAMTDMELRPTRHAGRGGTGAVMGSKGVKVIVLDGAGKGFREPKDPEKFRDANNRFAEGLKKHPVTGEALPKYGTNVLTNILSEAGGYPTYNFKTGSFPEASKISGESLAEVEIKRGGSATHGCHMGCIIQCSGIFVDKDGHYVTKQPEYETVWAHGGDCGISDLDAIAKIDFLDDSFGLDTIEMGATIAVAMEAGLAKFGDAEAAINLVKEVGKGTPLGRILGSGMANVARIYGIDRVAAVKGQGIPAHAARPLKGWGLTYATSPQGADHTAGVVDDENNLSATGQVEKSRGAQIVTAALDASGFCMFTLLHVSPKLIADMVSSFYGVKWTEADYMEMGKEMLLQERAYNYKAGIGPEADGLPDWMTKEPLPQSNAVWDVPRKDVLSVFNFE